MRIVLQRVKEAKVEVNAECIGAISKGLLLLVGICEQDTVKTIEEMAKKIVQLRIFEDETKKMNLSIQEVQGSILSVSQFTLYADCTKGRRPSFVKAAKPAKAELLYEEFNAVLKKQGIQVEIGRFGANMEVSLLNDGPATFVLENEYVGGRV